MNRHKQQYERKISLPSRFSFAIRREQQHANRTLPSAFFFLFLAAIAGCANDAAPPPPAGPNRLQAVVFLDPIRPIATNTAVALRGARNETIQLAIQLNQFPRIKSDQVDLLRVSELRSAAGPLPGGGCLRAYQLLPMPADTNRASFVRHTGLSPAREGLPRALLPLPMEDGAIPLPSLRNAHRAVDSASRADEPDAPPPVLWIDLQIPPTATPGPYLGQIELVIDNQTNASLPIKLTVDDFVIPDERHLSMVGLLDWPALIRLYPQQFLGLQPNLLSRKDPRYASAIRTLDQMLKLAQSHRTQLVIPQLQPIVKWPAGAAVQIDWSEFDSVVAPWLRGDLFPDLVPLAYWPLPRLPQMQMLDHRSQLEYWAAAAAHFDQADWLARSAVPLDSASPGLMRLTEAAQLSEQAATILAIHPRLRVTIPMLEEQVLLADSDHSKRIPRQALGRLLYAAAGLASATPLQKLPENAGTRWLRTDLPGLIPYSGAGADQREVRLWAWLAFLRNAQLIAWPSVLPEQDSPVQLANPDDLIWFYPGSWFGVSDPVPTLQLKWLRRAQQDYEYLWLARQRGQLQRATVLSRLISKPVEIPPTQNPDPIYALMSGSSDQRTWSDALDLLSQIILLSQPGQPVDPDAEKQLTYRMSGWVKMHERPLLVARSTEFRLMQENSPIVDLRLGIDIYNAADQQPEKNRLHWTSVPDAFLSKVPPLELPQLGTYTVNRFFLNTRVDFNKLTPASRQPLKVTFTDGFTGRAYSTSMIVPVAWSEQRQGPVPRLDGSLIDWSPEDAIHQGPLAKMLDKPSLQRQELQLASTPSAIYTTWTPASFYLAFRIDGADWPMEISGTNFVNYQLRRAWDGDVCEILIQPIYADNSVGPLLHVACKPRGQLEIARRLDPRLNASPWQSFVASDIRYGYSLSKSVWRGEIGIPWDAINDPAHAGKRPALLRMNFSQHLGTSGQSASWAGPIDYGRDEQFMGVLQIRHADVIGPPRGDRSNLP